MSDKPTVALGPGQAFQEALGMTDEELRAHIVQGGFFDPVKKSKWAKKNALKFKRDPDQTPGKEMPDEPGSQGAE